MMLHKVALDIFGIAATHRKMMLGIMHQIIHQVTGQEASHQRRHPLGRVKQDCQNQVIKTKEYGRQRKADRKGQYQARFHLRLGMVDAVEDEKDALLVRCGGVMVELKAV